MIIPGNNQFQSIGQGAAQGVENLLKGLAEGKAKQMQAKQTAAGLQALYGLSPEKAAAAAYLPPQLLNAYAKNQFKSNQLAQQGSDRVQRAQGLLQNLQQLQQEGNIDPYFFGKFGGGGADTYDLYAKELQKLYPDIVIPSSKHDNAARMEGLARAQARLEKDLQQFGGMPGQQGGFGQQQPMQQQMGSPEQDQQVPGQQEGYLESILRNLAGTATEAAGPIAGIVNPAAGAGIVGSDIVGGLENLGQSIKENYPLLARLSSPNISANEIRKAQGVPEVEDEQPFKISNYLPTTENIKKVVGSVLPKDYLEPRNKTEAEIRDAIHKVASLKAFSNMGLKSALVRAGAGIAGKQAAEKAGLGKVGQFVAETLFTMAPDVVFNPLREKYRKEASDIFNKFPAKEGAVGAREISIPEVKNLASEITNKIEDYQTLPTNKKIYDELTNFKSKTVFDKIQLKDAIDSRKNISRFLKESNLDDTGKAILSKFNEKLNDAISDQIAKLDIPGGKEYEKAKQIWRGLKTGESVVDAFKNIYKKGDYKSMTLGRLAGRFPAGAAGLALGGVTGVGAAKGALIGLGATELFQTYKFLNNTPGAWGELAKVAQESLKGNAKSAASRLAKLDNKALKFEQKNSAQQSSRARKGF